MSVVLGQREVERHREERGREQARGQEVDHRSDIFSLGTIFAELLLGRRFFERPSELATMKSITEEPIANAERYDNLRGMRHVR